jgi:two-component system response regulator FixJ
LNDTHSVVHIVDDEEPIRRSLRMLLRSVQIDVETHSSAASFLDHWNSTDRGCILLDVRMPEMSGLELQEKLLARGVKTPIIFMTAHADVSMAVRVMKNGAFDLLEKPFTDQQVLDRIGRALEKDRTETRSRAHREALHARYGRLTPREREVMELLLLGKANKMVAHDLAISERTVEIHRSRIMRKMGASSLAMLVTIGNELGP